MFNQILKYDPFIVVSKHPVYFFLNHPKYDIIKNKMWLILIRRVRLILISFNNSFKNDILTF